MNRFSGRYRIDGWRRWIPLLIVPMPYDGPQSWLRPWTWRGASVHAFGRSAYVIWTGDE